MTEHSKHNTPEERKATRHFNLRLTSPHTTDKREGGNQVQHAQHLLNSNRYGTFYKRNHNDGIYGPETAAATKHAKYALGFPDKEVNQRFDDPLEVRLSGERPLGAEYEDRRKKRKEQKKPDGTKIKAVQLALEQVGYHEGPNNANKFGEWYGLNHAPWCAIFASWCEEHVGNDWFHYSYCPNILSAAMHGDHGMSLTQHPEAGDLCLFGRPPHHVGLVVDNQPWRWVSGNWGDRVAVSTSRPSDLDYFVRMPG